MTDDRVEFPHIDHGPVEFAPRYYRRDGSPSTELEAEQQWADRGVAWAVIRTKGGSEAVVSTIFLGLDHAFPPGAGHPILFETAVYDRGGLLFRTRSTDETAARAAFASAVIDLVAAIETSTPDDPFPTAPVETPPASGYLPGVPLEEGTDDDERDTPGD